MNACPIDVIAQCVRPAVLPPYLTPVPAGGARLLFLDDEPAMLNAYRRLFGRENAVALGSTGAEGLAALLGPEPPDVVLCDLFLRGMSGFELYAALRRGRPRLLRRVLFITGGRHLPEVAELEALLGEPVLEKPFDMRALRARVAARAAEVRD